MSATWRPPLLAALAPVLAALAASSACDGETVFAAAPDHELLTQVQSAKYREWARAPAHEMRAPTNAPHGRFVEIFIDARFVDALANADGLGRTTWPEGATAVLEGYADELTPELAQLAILQKRHGSWYWEQYQGGELERPRFAGRPDVCVGCHDNGQDFTRSFSLPKMTKE